MPDDHTSAWNRFSADFTVPDSDDAARIANEAKASIDTWVQKSLSNLQADMSQRLQVNLAAFNQHIAESTLALGQVDAQIAAIRAGLDDLAKANPALAVEIAKLQKQTDDTSKAMQTAADQWEKNGQDAVATAISIAKTVATMA